MGYPKRCADIGFRLEFSFLPQNLYRSGANGNEECSLTKPDTAGEVVKSTYERSKGRDGGRIARRFRLVSDFASSINPVRGPFPVSRRDVVPVRIGDAPICHLLVPGATASLHASWSLTVPFLKREEHPGSAEILCSPAPFQRGWTRARSFTATYGARSSRSPIVFTVKRRDCWRGTVGFRALVQPK